ncbi:hypothetical protein GK047_27845 [Paenibacillus sp. SYP-B3998]|uniref:SF3 helicase domain-containing protein n=1 Tax=Paenibacillus sp. SYP-B3998 TaxID=2678564 RepID=A0A6G4A7G0_9BACL|nr:phage/plasmid primase, P4 family [Paenibacillus sp. SYP-B3998]NEW09739.1 hypothetical protein [Paenibacillus sp. SYP-B3998]
METDTRQLVAKALEQFTSGQDKGAPFERDVLQAFLDTRNDDPAEFQRLKAMVEDSGVSKRDLNDALRLHMEAAAKEATPSPLGGAALSPERIKELERKGFDCNPVKGITDVHPNLFAKHVLRTLELRITKGERFFLYEHGVWRPLPDKQLHRMLFRMIEEEQPGVWRPAWESGYMATLARLAKHVAEFDANKVHLNLTDGMFNTETFELEEHNPDFHSSIQTPIEYGPDAQCPRFLRFLNEIFQGDLQVIKVVQEIMGYCCTAETRAHKMFIFVGIGSNGKSVLLEIIEHLCGKQNVSHVAMNELSQPFSRAELVGKLLNVSSENEFSEKGLNTQQIKSITAGDMIRVENKHEKGFSYRPVCKLLFGMNALPTTLDKSHGFFRRLVIVPFQRVFKGAEVDKMLVEKLLEELPGIFNFAMEGLRRLRERNFDFTESKAISQAISSYKSEQNPVIPFVSDFVVQGTESERVGKNELFDRFQTWCRQQGETDFASKSARDRRVFWSAFRNALLEAGLPMPDERPSDGVRYLYGLTLLKEAKQGMTDLFEDVAGDAPPATAVVDQTESEETPHDQTELARITVGGKFEEIFEHDSEELLLEEDADDGGDLMLRGTDFEEAEREALEEAFDHESIQFDLNYFPVKLFHGLGFNEWLDSKAERFDFDDYRFEQTCVGKYEFVSLVAAF